MKLSKRIFSLLLTAVLFVSSLSVTAFAKGEIVNGIGFTTGSSLRLRSEPSTSSTVLDTAEKGEVLVVISKAGDWYKVNYNLQVGYMHANYVKVLTKENAELGYGEINGTSVNLRSGPSTGHKVVAVGNKGDKAYIIGLNEGWYKVIYGEKICYIRSDFLELTEIPYENTDSANEPKFFKGGKSNGVTPSAAALKGETTAVTPNTGSSNTGSSNTGSSNTGSSNTNSSNDGANNSETKEEETTNNGSSTGNSAAPETNESVTVPSQSGNSGTVSGKAIVQEAEKYLGIRYVAGGADPNGFDCSGFVYYVLKQLGYSPYRTPADQYLTGTYVAKSELQPGDIVFFQNTYKVGISHVGIYVGDGKFIHSPNSRSVVSYADLTTGYWSNHYYGARRVAG